MNNQHTCKISSIHNQNARQLIIRISVLLFLLFNTGCDSGDDSGGNTTQQYTVGGYVIGLEGTGLVLQNNSTDDLAIDSNDIFEFPSPLDDGEDYEVTVASHPANPFQVCMVNNSSGTINGTDVTNVEVACQRTTTGGNCVSGSIAYNHDLTNDYQGFSQNIVVTGSIPFTCDQSNNISGSGSLNIAITGGLIAQCTSCTWAGDATINVDLSGALLASLVTLQMDELWYVGSPLASGSCIDTCDGGTTSYQYPLIETSIQHTEQFPDIDGYTLVSPYIGQGASGDYNWTIYIQ